MSSRQFGFMNIFLGDSKRHSVVAFEYLKAKLLGWLILKDELGECRDFGIDFNCAIICVHMTKWVSRLCDYCILLYQNL
eukprot:CCRYP_008859-RA/>CCRYP_008859-RA protein AED:0.59 eAED:0.75 QI:0/0/0/1/0/0/2/0/78